MNLIYTFNKDVNIDHPEKLEVIIPYYINSMMSAKKLGYRIGIYTNCNWFDEHVDFKHEITDEYIFWDMFKIKAIDNETDHMLVDGDVIFDNKFPEISNDVDVYFDAWESWMGIYDDCVKELTELGIGSVIPEWRYEKQRVMNIGTLRINNLELKKTYIDRWYKMHEFCKERENEIETIEMCGTIAAQYLLTLLCTNSKKIHNFSNVLGKPNGFYTHHVGPLKYMTPPPRVKKQLL
jgi:hypothetical protein